jgi:hypothetical protein
VKRARFALVAGAALLSGCALQTSPPPPYQGEIDKERPGMLGDLRWNVDASGNWQRARSAEEDFKKWRETAGSEERREFEEWRAWQEWKRKNPK